MKSLFRTIGTINFLRLGLRRRVVRLFCSIDSSVSWPFSVHYHDVEYSGDISNAQEWHVYFFGGYELKEAALLKDLLKVMESSLVLDIGANLGCHTFVMAAGAKYIHAFEPYTPLAEKIEEQISRNKLENIQVHRFGLGNSNEIQKYYFDPESSNTGTGSFVEGHSTSLVAAELQMKRGDECIGDQAVDLVKIDIEGYECLALLGLSKTLYENKPIILMEVTETSNALFESNGGLDSVLKFDYDIYEVCNPNYWFGIFQLEQFSLKKCEALAPRKASFNVLIVPKERAHILDTINQSKRK